jgi:protein O-GlcNAc transferase
MRMWFRPRVDRLKSNLNSAAKAGESTVDLKSQELIKERGDAHLKRGELDQAEGCYRSVLKSVPLHRDALINLSFVLKELGRLPESIEFIDRALSIASDDADAHYLRATLHQVEGNFSLAVIHFERAATLRPEFEIAHPELVTTLFQTHRAEDAIRWCDHALERLPNSAELHFYRSNLHKHAGATDAAIASARTALKLQPGLLVARTSLSELLEKTSLIHPFAGEYDKGNGESLPSQDLAEAYDDLGLAYLWSSEFVAARSAFETALTLAPQVAEYHYNLGTVLRVQEDVGEAIASFDRAIALEPEHARARWAKSLAYASPFPDSAASAESARIKIMLGLEEFSRWSHGRVLQGEHIVGFNSPFYLSYQEQDNRPIFERYGSLCVRAMGYALNGRRYALPGAARPASGRMRIGVVSADIREHSVWFALIKGWFEHFDRNRFEIGIFSLTTTPDRETEWAQSHADFFVSGPKTVHQWVESISAVKPTVLIYPAIGLDVLTLQLASLRLAPTQINTWGHPETSGLPTIDLYLSGENFEPIDAQQFYSERLVPLINLGNCYGGRVQHAVEPDFAALGIDPGRPILICSGTPYKYQVEHDCVLTQITRQIDGSQLIFFRQRPESMSDLLEARLHAAFSRAGLDFARHVRFIPTQPLQMFHGLLGRANIALDTIGFSGYNTAVQAIESGLPLVTREGRFLRGRLASGILRRLGMTGLVAQTAAEYISLAVKLAGDVELQQRVRTEIIQRRPILYDDVASIRHLENVLEDHATS